MKTIEFTDEDDNIIIDEFTGEPWTLELSDESYELLAKYGRELEGGELSDEEAVKASLLQALKEAVGHGSDS